MIHNPNKFLNKNQNKEKLILLKTFSFKEKNTCKKERGVAVYTPFTVLPPPVLKSVGSSSLQRKRIESF